MQLNICLGALSYLAYFVLGYASDVKNSFQFSSITLSDRRFLHGQITEDFIELVHGPSKNRLTMIAQNNGQHTYKHNNWGTKIICYSLLNGYVNSLTHINTTEGKIPSACETILVLLPKDCGLMPNEGGKWLYENNFVIGQPDLQVEKFKDDKTFVVAKFMRRSIVPSNIPSENSGKMASNNNPVSLTSPPPEWNFKSQGHPGHLNHKEPQGHKKIISKL